MSDTQVTTKAADADGSAKWPEGGGTGAINAPVTAAALANAAARAAASASRRDLLDYLRLRRKAG